MGNREALVRKVYELGMQLGEKLWPLPLWDFFLEHLKSDIADFKNVGDRTAGAIVAGMFLKQFVPEEVPWLHLDIAGTAWTDKGNRGYTEGRHRLRDSSAAGTGQALARAAERVGKKHLTG